MGSAKPDRNAKWRMGNMGSRPRWELSWNPMWPAVSSIAAIRDRYPRTEDFESSTAGWPLPWSARAAELAESAIRASASGHGLRGRKHRRLDGDTRRRRDRSLLAGRGLGFPGDSNTRFLQA